MEISLENLYVDIGACRVKKEIESPSIGRGWRPPWEKFCFRSPEKCSVVHFEWPGKEFEVQEQHPFLCTFTLLNRVVVIEWSLVNKQIRGTDSFFSIKLKKVFSANYFLERPCFPCIKGIQARQSWILYSMARIPGSICWIPVFLSGTWILDFNH